MQSPFGVLLKSYIQDGTYLSDAPIICILVGYLSPNAPDKVSPIFSIEWKIKCINVKVSLDARLQNPISFAEGPKQL